MTCTSPDDLLNSNLNQHHNQHHDVNNNTSVHHVALSRLGSCSETSNALEAEKRCPENLQKVIALQQNVGSLAQLDIPKLATLLPPGMSLEQVQQIKMKLVHLNNLQQQQQQQHKRLERSISEPNNGAGNSGFCSGSSSSSSTDSVKDASLETVLALNSSRYKTELCRPFEENGICKYGDKCQFAHGIEELRSLARHPKYKTELCRTFHTTGLCPYGPRCHFIHNSEEEKRSKAHLSAPVSSAASQEALNIKMLHERNFESTKISPMQQQPNQDLVSPMPQMFKNRMLGLRPKALSIGCTRSLGSAGELSPPMSPAMYEDPFTPSYFNVSSRMPYPNSPAGVSSSTSSSDIPFLYPSPPNVAISPLAASMQAAAAAAAAAAASTAPLKCSPAMYNKPVGYRMPSMTYSASIGDQLMSAPAVISKSDTIFNFPPTTYRTSSPPPPPPLDSLNGQLNSLSLSSNDIAKRAFVETRNRPGLPRLPVFDQFSRRPMPIS